MKLTKEDIKHIANLARLELNEEELELYGEQLSAVLEYINQLKEVDTIDVEPTAQVTGLENIWRKDKIEPWRKDEVQAALHQAPETEDNQVKVRRVL